MFVSELQHNNIKLIKPDIERDAPLAVEWLAGEAGHKTLELMGVPQDYIKEPTIQAERQRVRDLIDKNDQINWMIQKEGKVVGTVWLDMKEHEGLPPPSLHIMIGDPDARGQGLGAETSATVINWLFSQTEHQELNSRYLAQNTGSQKMLERLGFMPVGNVYSDPDGQSFQNMSLRKEDWGNSRSIIKIEEV